jgi:S-(hydroxymethyl)glutathione dehydrogenase/alcohol dehydrogenase
MVQGACLAGAAKIIAVEPIAWRREMAGELGATDLVDPADGDPVEQVRALTGGRGADYVLEAAGMTAAQEQALTTARRAVAPGATAARRPRPRARSRCATSPTSRSTPPSTTASACPWAPSSRAPR